MSFLKDIFDYLEGNMSEEKKTDFFSCTNMSAENKKKFRDVLNFKVERDMARSCISQKEMNGKLLEIYAKIKKGGGKIQA